MRARAGDMTEELRPERYDAWRYKVGVESLTDGIERFYWPRMVSLARPEDTWNSEV